MVTSSSQGNIRGLETSLIDDKKEPMRKATKKINEKLESFQRKTLSARSLVSVKLGIEYVS